MLNGALVLVLVLIGGATFAALRSSSASSATTQTTATAKRGTVLESVTSTGNVEAPTSLSLSFQQSGEVTAVYVTAGQHVVKNQALAQVDDTQQRNSLASAKASLASAQAALTALKRGETAVERASDATSVASAAQSVTSAQQGVTNAQQSQAANATKYQQTIDQAQTSLIERPRRRLDGAGHAQPGQPCARELAEHGRSECVEQRDDRCAADPLSPRPSSLLDAHRAIRRGVRATASTVPRSRTC